MSSYQKLILKIAALVACCMISYYAGWGAGYDDALKPQREAAKQQEASTPAPSYLISAELFVPNFNACSSLVKIANYQTVQGDFIEFVNNSQSVIIIGKGAPAKLDSVGVIFPKRSQQAYTEAYDAIKASISAVSPSTSDVDRGYIMEQLGLTRNTDNSTDMKISEHKGIRYAVTYDAAKVSFMAMPIPSN
jgi:hypothetical protein